MNLQARIRLSGALAASCLALTPAVVRAQNNSASSHSTPSATQGQRMDADAVEVRGPESNRIVAMRTIRDLDLKAEDIGAILPLLEDLRDAQRAMWSDTAGAVDMMVKPNANGKMTGDDMVSMARDNFRTHRDTIWRTIAERIGQDKADRLRDLVQAREVTYSPATFSERVTRIDTLLNQWDTQAGARIAAAGSAPATTVTETTTTVTAEPAGRAHRSTFGDLSYDTVSYFELPPISTDQLVEMLQNRLVNMVVGPDAGQLYFIYPGQDVSSPDIKMIQERELRIWQ